MDADELKRHILTFDGVTTMDNLGDTFFTYDPDGDLPQDRWLPFTTLVTADNYDTVSDLTRRGAYRVNIGVTKATYVRLLGTPPLERDEQGLLKTDADFTAADVVMPHPFYANQYWLSVVNPGPRTSALVHELLAEAYAFAVRKYANQKARKGC
jgi:hypothetical protein